MPVETDTALREILELDPIAVIGCSTTPGKPAHDVPEYMLEQGYEIIPVNPFADEIFGRDAFDSITDVPGPVPLVDVFRPSEELPGIVDSVLERDDVDALWMQLGISHDDAAARAEEAGLQVVQDRCIMVEHKRLR